MASQQPPARPWFRLATMIRPPPPPTTPAAPTPQPDLAPPPRPAFIRPAFSQTFRVPTTAPPPEPTPPPPPVAPPPPPFPVTAPPLATPSPPPSPPSAPPLATPSPPPTVVTPPPPSSPITKVLSAPSPRIVSAQPPPSSPITKVLSAPSTPLQNSPTPKPVSPSPPQPSPSPSPSRSRVLTPTPTAGPTTTIIRTATPISSPKIVKQSEKTPPPSPNIKPISHPPSPLTLPSPKIKSYNNNQAEFEQKTVLVQETKEKPKVSPPPKIFNSVLHRHIGEIETHGPRREITKENGTHKKHSDSEDFGTRIITIAGQNKGAIMELSPSGKKHEFGNNPHSLQVKKGNNTTAWSDGEKSGSDGGNVTGEERRSKMKGKNEKATPLLMTAVMNSNVQGVNNSILYNCSTTHHDPGVHLSLSRKPDGGPGFHLKDHGNS